MSENVEAVEEQSAEALQRGQRSKWSKARKADFEGRKGNKRQKQEWVGPRICLFFGASIVEVVTNMSSFLVIGNVRRGLLP